MNYISSFRFNLVIMSPLLALLSAVTACSSGDGVLDELASGNAINFAATAADVNATRGAITDLTVVKADGFSVYATTTDPTTGRTTSFMNAQQVEWDGTDWTYAPEKYWPNDDREVSFYPVHNDPNGNLAVTTDWDGTPYMTYTTPTDVAKHTDLLWAPAVTASKTSVSGAVTFHFQHALSGICLRIAGETSSSNGTTPLTVVPTSVTLSIDAPQSGQLLPEATAIESAWYVSEKRQMRDYTFSTFAHDDAAAQYYTPDDKCAFFIPCDEAYYEFTIQCVLNGKNVEIQMDSKSVFEHLKAGTMNVINIAIKYETPIISTSIESLTDGTLE